MRSQQYIIIFVLVMTGITALILAGMNTSLKDRFIKNEEIYNKKGILASIQDDIGKPANELSNEEIDNIFDNDITQFAVDAQGNVIDGVMAQDIDMAKEKKLPLDKKRFPVYVYKKDGKTLYIVSMRGAGLWDEIWGSVALQSDMNTIEGAAFDHKGETPGLGAEIKDNPKFAAQLKGKKIFDKNGKYTSVRVVKGGAKHPDHEIDAISGATITSNGVNDMLYSGIEMYLPYLDHLKTN